MVPSRAYIFTFAAMFFACSLAFCQNRPKEDESYGARKPAKYSQLDPARRVEAFKLLKSLAEDLHDLEVDLDPDRKIVDLPKTQKDAVRLESLATRLVQILTASTPIKIGGGTMTFSSPAAYEKDSSRNHCAVIDDPDAHPITLTVYQWKIVNGSWTSVASTTRKLSSNNEVYFYGRDEDGDIDKNSGVAVSFEKTCIDASGNSQSGLSFTKLGNGKFYTPRDGSTDMDTSIYVKRFKHPNCPDQDTCERMSDIYVSGQKIPADPANPSDLTTPTCINGDCYVELTQ